jgi:hypothetical protein
MKWIEVKLRGYTVAGWTAMSGPKVEAVARSPKRAVTATHGIHGLCEYWVHGTCRSV